MKAVGFSTSTGCTGIIIVSLFLSDYQTDVSFLHHFFSPKTCGPLDLEELK